MLFRWALPLAILVVMAVPAVAADESVRATPTNEFEPADVTVDVGDTVTWSNSGGFHNVKFDDGSFEQPAAPDVSQWTVEHKFDTPGVYRYYCEQHGGPNGSGMAGKVSVRDATGSVPEPVKEAPGFTISAPSELALKRALKRGVRVKAGCKNGCDVRLKLSLDARTAKRFGFKKRRTTIGTAFPSFAPGGPALVGIDIRERAKKRLRGAERAFKVRLDARATKDTSETARRTIKIKP